MKILSTPIGLAAALLCTTTALGPAAHAADPPVPNGQDPGGTAVAIITTGIDYTVPDIAKALARDGEGETIAWDFVDSDNRPYAREGEAHGQTMIALLSGPGVRIVTIRISHADALWLARSAAFAERTPASVLVVPVVATVEELDKLAKVARRFSMLHVVAVPAGDADTDRIKGATAGLNNVSIFGASFCSDDGQADAVRTLAAKLCTAR